jgi:hypothetical protein
MCTFTKHRQTGHIPQKNEDIYTYVDHDTQANTKRHYTLIPQTQTHTYRTALTRALTQTHTRNHSTHSHSLTLSHTHSHSHTLSLSLKTVYTLTSTHTHIHTLTLNTVTSHHTLHSHPPSGPHTRILMPPRSLVGKNCSRSALLMRHISSPESSDGYRADYTHTRKPHVQGR